MNKEKKQEEMMRKSRADRHREGNCLFKTDRAKQWVREGEK